jgi:hypothetical protein
MATVTAYSVETEKLSWWILAGIWKRNEANPLLGKSHHWAGVALARHKSRHKVSVLLTKKFTRTLQIAVKISKTTSNFPHQPTLAAQVTVVFWTL